MINSTALNLSLTFFKTHFNWVFNLNYIKEKRKIKRFENINLNKKVIIICNGPSLNEINFDDIQKRNIDTIGLNKINLLFSKTDFRPNYIVAINKHVIDQNKSFYRKTIIPTFLDANNSKEINSENICKIFSLPNRGYFSEDISKGYCQGFTVTFAALQLAYYMGYNQIALIGCDHYFKDKGIPNKLIISKGDDLNHFDKSYFKKGDKWQLPDLIGSEFHYQIARDLMLTKNIKIVNCTENSYLNIFPKEPLIKFINDR